MSVYKGLYSIYKITNLVNGKVYIGQTKGSIEKRWKEHCRKNSFCSKLRRAIQKYGKNNFSIEQIDHAHNQEELDSKEIFWIKKYNSTEIGYNIAKGGHITGKQRAVVCLETNKVYDSILECCKELDLLPGMVGAVCSGRKGSHKNLHFAYIDNGIIQSKRLKKCKEPKKVMCYETGVVYKDCLQASKDLGLSRNAVSEVAYGRTPTCNGMHFFFIDKNWKPIIDERQFKKRRKKTPVLCIETGIIYESPKIASEKTGIYKESIFQSIRKGCCGGGFHWEKYNKGGK